MSAPQEDAELRDKVVEAIAFGRADGNTAGVVGDAVMQLIKARDEQRERETRKNTVHELTGHFMLEAPLSQTQIACVRRYLTNPQEQDKEEE